jgi:ubiquinone/menaquinone biosynthesis C-methylase UbiE
MMQWGQSYKTKHVQILNEYLRVLAPGGSLVVNVSDHVRKGTIVSVVAWWEEAILDTGFEFHDYVEVPTRRMRNGENASARVGSESILVYRKPGRRQTT